MICHQSRTVFVHVPQAAGQSIEQHYLDRLGLDWKDNDRLFVGVRLGDVLSTHLYADEYVARGYLTPEQWGDYDRWAVVRNPWARAVSSYKYLMEDRVPFEAFLTPYTWEARHPSPRRHGVPQVRYVGDCRVLRFENLAEDYPELPWRNVSPDSTDYRRFYNDRTRQLVADAYAEDIERWGYSFDA